MNEEITNILLVEDSADDAEFFVHTFKKSGLAARLHIIEDGAEALEFLFCTGRHALRSLALRPNFIVLDLKLPKVGGLEVLRRIKADPATRTIPVIVFSSSQEEQDIAESYKIGVSSYLLKPVDFDGFSNCVQMLAEYWLKLNLSPKH